MMTTEELNMLADQYKECKKAVDEAEARLNEIKDALKAEMDLRQEEKVSTESYNIFYKLKTRTTADNDKLKEAGLWDMYSKQNVFPELRVTAAKAKA